MQGFDLTRDRPRAPPQDHICDPCRDPKRRRPGARDPVIKSGGRLRRHMCQSPTCEVDAWASANQASSRHSTGRLPYGHLHPCIWAVYWLLPIKVRDKSCPAPHRLVESRGCAEMRLFMANGPLSKVGARWANKRHRGKLHRLFTVGFVPFFAPQIRLLS